MSNKFDDYDDNDEITLSSTSNNKTELKRENARLKKELEDCYNKIRDYEEVISNSNVQDITTTESKLSKDDLFNIMHNQTFIIPVDN